MSRNGRSKDTIRVTLDMSPDLNQLLDELARAQHTSKAEVLRRGIAMMKFAQQEREKGRRIGSADPDQELATEVVGF